MTSRGGQARTYKDVNGRVFGGFCGQIAGKNGLWALITRIQTPGSADLPLPPPATPFEQLSLPPPHNAGSLARNTLISSSFNPKRFQTSDPNCFKNTYRKNRQKKKKQEADLLRQACFEIKEKSSHC